MGVLCTWVKLLKELHKLGFGGGAPPGPAGGAIALTRDRKGWEQGRRGSKGREAVGRDEKGKEGKGVEGAKEGDRLGKEEGGLRLDICPGAPSS